MKRLFLIFSAILLSIPFGLLFVVSSVSAASPFDNVVQTTNALDIKCINSNDETLSLWNAWSSLVYGDALETTGWGTPVFEGKQVIYGVNETYLQNFRTALSDRVADGTGWGVTLRGFTESSGTSDTYVDIYAASSSSFSPTFGYHGNTNDPGLFSNPSQIYSLSLVCDGDNLIFSTNNSGNPNSVAGQFDYGTWSEHAKVFFLNFDIEYPEGYAGEQPPKDYNPPAFFNPEHTWTVSPEGELRVRYDKNYPGYARVNSYWELRKTDDDPPTLLDTKLLTPYETAQYTYTLPGAGYYEIAVGYTGSYPVNWGDYSRDWNGWNSSLFSIYWDGFSFASGNNHDRGECDIVCKNYEQDPISNIGGAFGRLNVDMHGLQAIILMPINFIASLPTYVDNCQPINFSFYGSSQQLPCAGPAYANIGGGVIYGIWQTVITAVVVFAIAFDSFRIIKNVNTPRNDSIELEKL